ncbi:kinase-like domain-containing protein [Mycena crocata]|nr:kinase-like domain-containing protein [Mycena crocata]
MSATPVPFSLYRHFSDFHLIVSHGYGTVYKAVERATNRTVAVKTLTWSPTKECPNRYVHEEQQDVTKDFTILHSLSHPHVVNIIWVYQDRHTEPPNLVLEYAGGGMLIEYLWKFQDGLPELECRDIMYQLCQAMAYIHRLGIVHRNLKPENILLTGDKMPFIKIAGFGFAVKSHGAKLKEVRGSLPYMAPEMIHPSLPGYDHRADSWSAGIILFSMLLLTSPYVTQRTYPEDHPPEMEWNELHGRLSAEGFDFLAQLLSEDPSKRGSLVDAVAHRWLVYHRPMYPNILYPEP